jgi:Uncharacterised MFS-type transporter YbfB
LLLPPVTACLATATSFRPPFFPRWLADMSTIRRVGMMTAAFAVGQIAGPLSVSLFAGSSNAFTVTSIIAALGLVLGNCVLSTDDARSCLPMSGMWKRSHG